MLVEVGADGREQRPDPSTADGPDARALFVLRSLRPGQDTPIVYKLSWATFHAYNGTGGGSLYAEGVWSTADEPRRASRSPGGGRVGAPAGW